LGKLKKQKNNLISSLRSMTFLSLSLRSMIPFSDGEILAFTVLFLTVFIALLINRESKIVFVINTSVWAIVLGIFLGMDDTPGNHFLEYYLYFWMILAAIGVLLAAFVKTALEKW